MRLPMSTSATSHRTHTHTAHLSHALDLEGLGRCVRVWADVCVRAHAHAGLCCNPSLPPSRARALSLPPSLLLSGGVRFPYFFPLDGRSPVSHPTCEVPFPPRRSGEYRKGMIPARPLYQGVCDQFETPNPRKSGSVIWADRQRFGPSCVLLKRVPQGRTESGGIVLAANAGSRVPSGSVTLKRRCRQYLPTFSHLFDCQ